MSYTLPPGPRLEYDIDGSVVVFNNASLITLTQTQRQNINDESLDTTFGIGNTGANRFFGVLFPTPTIVNGWVVHGDGAQSWSLDWSNDTTTGVDGTWTTVETTTTVAISNPQHFLSNIRTVTLPQAVSAVRARTSYASANRSFYSLHLYGRRADTGNWITMWHPVNDAPLTDSPEHTSLGSVGVDSGTHIVSFRIKNESDTSTANDIVLSSQAIPDVANILGSVKVRYNGGSWADTVNIGSLAPGAISAVCDVRVVLGGTTNLGIAMPRVLATPGSWS